MRAAALALLLLPAAAAAQPGRNGFNMPCWWKDCYAQPKTAASLRKLAQTGAGWVALTPTWMMAGSSDSTLAPTDATPTEAALRAGIRAAKAAGLSVALKPHVDVSNSRVRALIHPKDAKAWFAVYRRMLVGYARLAAEERVDMLVVGTELFRLSGLEHRRDWERVVAEVRAVYPGPLTYASNWYDFERVSFWDKLDFIGIDCYVPMPGSSRTMMKLGWHAFKPLVAAASAAYGKPVIFTEFGISAQKGAQLEPWEWQDFGPLDLAVQTDYFSTFLEVFGDAPWFAGLWQWGWEIDPDAGGPADKSMTVQGKPALEVLKAFFAKGRAPAGLSAAQRLELERRAARALLAPVF